MKTYLVTANLNVATDDQGRRTGAFGGYADGDKVATVGYFDITAADETAAAERVFEIGNVGARDDHGKAWPAGVPSLSKGDVLYLAEGDEQETRSVHTLACASAGWDVIAQPNNACQVPLAGSVADLR